MMDEKRIEQDLSCIECGYNLRTVHRGGRCPECGSELWRTMRRRHGWLLDVAVLRRMRLAVMVLFAANFVAAVAWWVVVFLLNNFAAQVNKTTASILIVILLIAVAAMTWGMLQSGGPKAVVSGGRGRRIVLRLLIVHLGALRVVLWPLVAAASLDMFGMGQLVYDWDLTAFSLLMTLVALELLGWLTYALYLEPLVQEVLYRQLGALHFFYGVGLVGLVAWMGCAAMTAVHGDTYFLMDYLVLPVLLWGLGLVFAADVIVATMMGLWLLFLLWRELGRLAAPSRD
ncbi:MAG: hypothetical protein IT445_06470 [Phycisphaeraceae bacterium]|nr:hypothetical protein [Phycisphaeraceae bacterium]